jgi:hypothetical protein
LSAKETKTTIFFPFFCVFSHSFCFLPFGQTKMAIVTITSAGIRFTVEESKSFQGVAILEADIFQEYLFTGQTEEFKINFGILMDCLNIFGSTNSLVGLQMAYGGYGQSLILILEENGVLANCGLSTLEAGEAQNFNFRGSPIPSRVIMEVRKRKKEKERKRAQLLSFFLFFFFLAGGVFEGCLQRVGLVIGKSVGHTLA